MSRRINVVVASAVCAAMLVTAPVGNGTAQSPTAQSPTDQSPTGRTRTVEREVHRRTVAAGTRPAVRPGVLRAATPVTATVLLAGVSVSEQVAANAEAGVSMSAAGRRAHRQRVAASQQAAVAAVTTNGVKVLYTMQDAVSGLVVRGTRAQIEALRRLPGVLEVQVSRKVRIANSNSNEFSGVHEAWQDFGATGAGQTIAIIDDGIDYTHADFGGSGDPDDYTSNDPTTIEGGTFPTAKVVAGYDFVGDDYDASSDDPALWVPQPDPDPLACGEHGTHVAGTAAGYGVAADGTTFNGPWTEAATTGLKVPPGAAPQASLMAFKVFGCDGSVDDAIIIAAIDRAVASGATVINMSLGSDYGTADSVETRAIDNATRGGALVVVSAGNAGPNPYIVGSPSTSTRALSVAALDAVPTIPAVTMSFASTTVDGQNSNRSGALPLTATAVVLDDGDGGISLGCDPAEYAGTAGKIVIVLRGDCGRVEKLEYGADAGAAAVVMVNNEPGMPPVEGVIAGITIPFIGVDGDDAAAIVGADGVSTTISPGSASPNPGYSGIADFSSGGPRLGDSAAKPDIAAPGVGVASALVGSGSDVVELGGTSMSAPHVSGIAALVRAAHPTWTANQAKAALMNTATTENVANYDVRSMGAGSVAAHRAITTSVVATTKDGANSLSFGFVSTTNRIDQEQRFTIENHSGAAVRYDLSVAASGDDHGATFVVSPSSVSVPAGGRREISLRIRMTESALAALPGVSFYEIGPTALTTVRGAVVATPQTEAPALRVPFLLVPKAESDVRIESLTGAAPVLSTAKRRSSVIVRNRGVHGGTADVYAWQLSDRTDKGADDADLLAAGVQTLWLDEGIAPAGTGDPLLVFAVQFAEGRSTAAPIETDIVIDTNSDDLPDFALVSMDLGFLLEGIPDGYWGNAVIDLASEEIVAVYDGDAPYNGSVIGMPVFASDLGLTAGSSVFRWTVAAYDLITGGEDWFDGLAVWDAIDPTVVTGQWTYLDPGASDRIDFAPGSIRRGKHDPKRRTSTVLGYMVVSVDDKAGSDQVGFLSVAR